MIYALRNLFNANSARHQDAVQQAMKAKISQSGAFMIVQGKEEAASTFIAGGVSRPVSAYTEHNRLSGLNYAIRLAELSGDSRTASILADAQLIADFLSHGTIPAATEENAK